MRNLNVVADDYILKLSGVTDNALAADKSTASDECALTYFCLRSDDAGACDICGIENLCTLCDPDAFTLVLINFGIRRPGICIA